MVEDGRGGVRGGEEEKGQATDEGAIWEGRGEGRERRGKKGRKGQYLH